MNIRIPKITKRSKPRTTRGDRRRRLSYANVASTLALFLALTGVGYAAATLTGADIVDGSLTGADVQDNSLWSTDLGTDSVGYDELAANSVYSVQLGDGAIKTQDFNYLAVAPHAKTADSAGSAGTANNAHTLDGMDSTAFVHGLETVEGPTESLDPLGAKTTWVQCPYPKRVLGGGHSTQNGVEIHASLPNTIGDRWYVSAHNHLDAARTVKAWAVCARGD